MGWVKKWINPTIRQGENGTLTLPGKWNGINCFGLYDGETLQAIEWSGIDEGFVWRTRPFSEDLIFAYTYQKTKQEALDFLLSIDARKIKQENSGKKNKELFLEWMHSLIEKKGHCLVAGIFLVAVLGGGDDGF